MNEESFYERYSPCESDVSNGSPEDTSGGLKATLGDLIQEFGIRPPVLRDPTELAEELPSPHAPVDFTSSMLRLKGEAPYGFTGPSGVLPTHFQSSSHFIPAEDRWRLGLG